MSNDVTFSKLTLHKLDWLEWTTMILGVWFIAYPHPYKVLLGVLLAIPIIGLLLNSRYKPSIATLVRIKGARHDIINYDVADFIDFAAWAILIRVLIDFEFESIYSLIIPGTIAFVAILLILFLTHKLIASSTLNKWWLYTSLIFNISLYSYAGTYAANCAYDYSTPQVYETEVLGKRIEKRKRRRRANHLTYYIRVAPWGHHLDEEEIKVSRAHYYELNVGEKIKMDVKDGLFGIPWYFIERNQIATGRGK